MTKHEIEKHRIANELAVATAPRETYDARYKVVARLLEAHGPAIIAMLDDAEKFWADAIATTVIKSECLPGCFICAAGESGSVPYPVPEG